MGQTLSNSEHFKQMLNFLQANFLQSSNSTDTLNTKDQHYCWINGCPYYRFHTSASNENLAEGHQKGAMWENEVDGIERDNNS